VFYRRIWSIVGKYSILCCDNSGVSKAFGELLVLIVQILCKCRSRSFNRRAVRSILGQGTVVINKRCILPP
jgi:hypothetical protein